MTRDEWLSRFADELQRLRPHLRPQFGVSKVVRNLAVQAYVSDDEDPEAAARATHARMPPPPAKRP